MLAALFGVTACGGSGDDPAPVAAFTATPTSGPVPLTVQLDASSSSVSGSATYRWDFGDLDISTNRPSEPGSGVRTTHVFNYADSFAVTLTVTDSLGRVSRSSRTLEISGRAMPNLVGLSQAQATATLAAIGMPLAGAAPVVSDVLPVGTVVGQTPAAGEQLVQLTDVYVNLSSPIVVRDVHIRPFGTSPWLVPASGVVIGDVNQVVADGVGSVYEIAEVVARVGGVDTPLPYSSSTGRCARASTPCPGYVANVSFAGQPVGEVTFEIHARDVRGNEDVRVYTVTHDRPPLLTISQPVNNGAFLGTVPIVAGCSDDTSCSIEVRVGSTTYASGPTINTSIDLSAFVNGAVDIVFRAQDQRNQPVSQVQSVFIEDPARLSVVAQVPGDILDLRDTRVLYAIYDASGDRLVIRDLPTGAEEQHQAVGRSIQRGFLLPTGAIYSSSLVGANPRTATLWRHGNVIELGSIVPSSLSVAGEFAIYEAIGIGLRLLNSTSGTIEDITPLLTDTSVAADGTVVFTASGPVHQLFRYRSGVQTPLTNAPTQSHARPLTDGENTVFHKSVMIQNQNVYSIALLEDTTETVLANALSDPPQPAIDYAIANGWVAFTRPGAQLQKQVHVRSPGPTGTIQQRTQYSTSSTIDALRDNGELMLINQSRRYFSDGVSLLPVSSSNGTAYFFNGAWHIANRSMLFAVDTSD